MTLQLMFDPFSLWKGFYDKSEENFSALMHETLETESFAEWMGQIQSGMLQYQKLVHQTTDFYLKQLNLPTREEITNIATLVINVEEKLEELDEKVEDELLNQTLAEEIVKMKTSIAKLERKVDQYIKIRESIIE